MLILHKTATQSDALSAGIKGETGWTYAGATHQADPFLLKPEANKPATVIARNKTSLPGLALICICQSFLVSMAQGATAPPPGSTYSLAAVTNSLDELDCTAAECAEVERLLTKGNPYRLPVDSDEIPGVSVDRAHHSLRYNQETPVTTNTTLDPIVMSQPGTLPAFLFPNPFTESLRACLRERAPPSLT